MDTQREIAKILSKRKSELPPLGTTEYSSALRDIAIAINAKDKRKSPYDHAIYRPGDYPPGAFEMQRMPYEMGSVDPETAYTPVSDDAEMRSYTPSLRERVGNFFYDNKIGMDPAHTRRVVQGAADFVPGVGDAIGVDDAVRDYQAGNYGMAAAGGALAAAGMIPVVGDAVAAGGRKALNAAEAAGSPYRISTRLPTAVKAAEDPNKGDLLVGIDEFKRSPVAEHNTGLVTQYPGMAHLRGKPTEEAADGYVKRTSENLEFIHDNIEPEIRERSKTWYVGANQIATDLSQKYSLPRQSVSGVMAALSPQKDWFQNASLGERVIDITVTKGNIPMTREMTALAPQVQAFNTPAVSPILQTIMGAKLSDLQDPIEKALWVRLYDEAHNPRRHRIITPEGGLADFAMGQKGPKGTAWGSLNEIAKAVGAIESGGDREVLSNLMGNKHKVRSFYNNIEDPFSSMGDVTSDTHAVAANLMTPLSGNTPEAAHNFGSSLATKHQPPGYVGARGSSLDGIHGTYPLNAEAYRKAGATRGTLPREMQSITWEGVRSLFPETFKTAKNVDAVKEIWRAVDAGQISAEQARRLIVERAGGFRAPDWAGRGGPVYDARRHSTYKD